MNILKKLFKDYKTRRELIEENKNLRELLMAPKPGIKVDSVNVQMLCAEIEVDNPELAMCEYIRKEIVDNLAKEIMPYVDFETKRTYNKDGERKQFRGSLYVVVKQN